MYSSGPVQDMFAKPLKFSNRKHIGMLYRRGSLQYPLKECRVDLIEAHSPFVRQHLLRLRLLENDI